MTTPSDWLDALAWTQAATPIPDESEWQDSPWLWWFDLKIGKIRGTVAEHWLLRWLSMRGMAVRPRDHPGVDGYVNGHPVEIKEAVVSNGRASWFQVRDDPYEDLLLLGFWPQRVALWCIPKKEAIRRTKNQHLGARGSGETQSLTVQDPETSWLDAFGGDLEAGFTKISERFGEGFYLS